MILTKKSKYNRRCGFGEMSKIHRRHGFGENTDCGNREENKIDLEVLGLSLFPSPDIDN